MTTKMKKQFILSVIFSIAISLSAQNKIVATANDTIFYQECNGFLVPGNKSEKTVGYSIKDPNREKVYINRIYYIMTTELLAQYEVYDKDDAISQKNIKATLPIKNGNYEEWYLSGNKRLICHYTNDKLDGEFQVFYENGNLKRYEKWENGEWLTGECYDEQGHQTDYCSYHEMAEYIGGITKLFQYIGNHIKYPRYAQLNGIEGTVYVRFTIDTDGSVINVEIARGVEQHLNNEAIRIVSNMPKWKPGRFEGKVVQTVFTLPVAFKLES